MKKIYTLCFVAIVAMFANSAFAQKDVEMYAFVGSAADKSNIPVTIYLVNPTVEITAIEASFTAPVSVDKFIYDEAKESWKIEDTDRWYDQHSAKCAAGTALHGNGNFFVSVANSKVKPFKEKEGAVATVYFDGSELAEGDYVVTMLDALAVDTKVQSYSVANVDASFHVNGDGTITAVGAIAAEAVAAGKDIYTIGGQKVTAPQKGQIYVVDGKVVKY